MNPIFQLTDEVDASMTNSSHARARRCLVTADQSGYFFDPNLITLPLNSSAPFLCGRSSTSPPRYLLGGSRMGLFGC